MNYYRVLSIAGSDSGGGAGIQADIKSIQANGGFATTAITAITAQNTIGVHSVFPLPTHIIEAQIQAVVSDIGVDAVKIGMLHDTQTIQAVSAMLKQLHTPNIVVDPVMVATSGHTLLQTDALYALQTQLIPLSTIITPNLPEAELLLNASVKNEQDMRWAAKELSLNGTISVLIKGGHLQQTNELFDILFDATTGQINAFYAPKIDTKNTHGTGCTLSAAIATYLAQRYSIYQAVQAAKVYIHQAIIAGAPYTVGKGHGPVNHFFIK